MTREVVVAAAALVGVSPSIGFRTAVSTPVSRATVSAIRGETSVSKKIVVAPRCAHQLDDALEVARRRLGLGREARDRDLLEAVALREVAERLVARDDLAPLAVGEALAETRASSASQTGDEPLSAAGSAASAVPIRSTITAYRSGSSQT